MFGVSPLLFLRKLARHLPHPHPMYYLTFCNVDRWKTDHFEGPRLCGCILKDRLFATCWRFCSLNVLSPRWHMTLRRRSQRCRSVGSLDCSFSSTTAYHDKGSLVTGNGPQAVGSVLASSHCPFLFPWGQPSSPVAEHWHEVCAALLERGHSHSPACVQN